MSKFNSDLFRTKDSRKGEKKREPNFHIVFLLSELLQGWTSDFGHHHKKALDTVPEYEQKFLLKELQDLRKKRILEHQDGQLHGTLYGDFMKEEGLGV